MIVDDTDNNRELLKTYLEGYGFGLFEVSNGRETIESVRKHQPDLVLLDMMMPKIDGFEVSEVIKNDEHIKGIPLVVVTESTSKYDKEQLFKICDEFLSKPVKRKELLRKIVKFLPHTVKKVN